MIDFDILKRFRPGVKNRVALDIGSDSIKMLEISGASEKPALASFGIRKIQGSSDEASVDAVKALSEELKITVKDLNISLSGPSVVVRVISMPDMTDEELKNAIRFETEKSIPFDINECAFDFYIQGKDVREKNNLNILLAAAKKDSVLAKIKIAEEAGFRVNVIDVDSFAVTNAFIRNYASIKPARTIALLNIGATYTNLAILNDGLIAFIRDLTTGLKAVSSEKAADTGPGVKSALVSLVNEIKLSFGYHENQSGKGVDEIYISGGGAGFAGMEEAFSETFGIKPERWDPFKFLTVDPSAINMDAPARPRSSFAVCAGLALRGNAW
ncbi:MAG: pilus assembly protein PilM [Candidatus Omnitrophica bacterium]|nr:pilus assembly protein PilM [Candidatus Omnitrophota bacterium]